MILDDIYIYIYYKIYFLGGWGMQFYRLTAHAAHPDILSLEFIGSLRFVGCKREAGSLEV